MSYGWRAFLRRLLAFARLGIELGRRARREGRWPRFRQMAARILRRGLGQLERDLPHRDAEALGLRQPAMERLRREAPGLAGQLPGAKARVTIVVVVAAARPAALERCLRSCLDQAGEPEIVVGRAGIWPAAICAVVDAAQAAASGRLVVAEGALPVAAATGELLLLVDGAGWLRPDLLYRYRQVLSLEEKPRLVSCAAWPVDPDGEICGEADLRTTARPNLPLALAAGDLGHAVLVPKDLALGWSPPAEGAPLLDLALTVAARCQGIAIPVPLAGRPAERQGDAESAALRRHFGRLGAGWRVDPAGRPRPPEVRPTLQVIVPFRDQGELTRACVGAVLAQAWPGVELTAVDNGSADAGLGPALAALGATVSVRDEAFNFSRLVNAAARESRSELVLMLNNDVLLEPGALAELAAWAVQEQVGLVGAALFYPDGRLQHGGLDLDPLGRAFEQPWQLAERGLVEAALVESLRPRVVDGVSCACAMIRRSALESVDGLDEVFYPIAFSDTDLALRLSRRGYLHVYTPFAGGRHVESASRPGDRLEDFEGSMWLRHHLESRRPR